jgi:hypothetical protein
MKRAKIMLIAIAVIATVGGALAFKAQRFVDKNVFCYTKTADGILTCKTSDFKTTLAGPIVITPCSTFHVAVGFPTLTSSYLTTCVIGGPLPTPTTVVKVTTTNIQ